MFEIDQKCRIWIFQFWDFHQFLYDLSGITIWPQASGFQKLVKLTIFGIFDEIVKVARFARKNLLFGQKLEF